MATHPSGPVMNGLHTDKELKQKQQDQVHRTILIPPLPPPSQQQKQAQQTQNVSQDPKMGASSTQTPKTKPVPASTRKSKRPLRPTAEEVEARPHQDANEDDQDLVKVETYSDYKPAKVLIGRPHPDPVVETSSLATVEPPEIYYDLKLPDKVMDEALLSSLQLESVIYASQQHSQMTPDNRTRRGFLIGDGAGVGKGRTVAGIIYENYLNGRKKSIWLSVSADLRLDAERDLKDIGANIPVFLLGKFAYGKRINENRGVMFTTYSGLVSESKSVQGPSGSRLGQLISWVGPDFDGVIVFDECHKAKNVTMGGEDGKGKVTKAAEYVVKLQAELPNARVVYASATGASETRHLGYMTRLGLWGKCTGYPTFTDFCKGIESRGVSAMELVAVELKKRGSYIARQLSFKTTSFAIERAPLTSEFVQLYDDCVDMWTLAFRHFEEAEEYIDRKQTRSWWGAFWGAHQRFFKYLCISVKVPLVVDIAKQAIKDRKCVVIGLQSTGEAKTREAMQSCDVDKFVSTAGATFEFLIENSFPAPPIDQRLRIKNSRRDSSTIDLNSTDNSDHSDDSDPLADLTTNLNALKIDHPNFDPRKRLLQMQKELYDKIDKLAPRLPDNTLDDLIHKLGGPDRVAEMTGRTGRFVKDSKGRVRYQQRNTVDPMDVVNIREKERFMAGEKLIAIISEAASSGVSLQADRRVANQRRRVHITIELPWSADRAIQQFGRTHRSNQVSGPEYVFIISDLAGEIRFASIVAKRLESLGALTHGDRRAATEQRDISEFNISPNYCRRALEYVNEVINDKIPYYFDNIKPNYEGEFIEDTRAAYIGVGLGSWQGANAGEEFTPEKQSMELNIFLNRILGMKVRLQNALFDLFSRFVDRLILLDKRAGQYERGILEVNPDSGEIRIDSAEDLSIRTNEGVVECRLRNIEVDRGISWERASNMYELDDSDDRRSGFYQSDYSVKVYLAILEGPNQFRVHTPNLGTYSGYFNYGRVREDMHSINVKKAEKLWRLIYDATGKHCVHLLYGNNCKTTKYGYRCDTGMRIRYFSILSGAILTTLPYLSKKVPEAFKSLDIIRLRLGEDAREIGPYIQRNVEEVRDALMEAQEKGIFWDQDSSKP